MTVDYVVGFGGKFGVQSDRQDQSALGWDHHEAPQKHGSQLDHKKVHKYLSIFKFIWYYNHI